MPTDSNGRGCCISRAGRNRFAALTLSTKYGLVRSACYLLNRYTTMEHQDVMDTRSGVWQKAALYSTCAVFGLLGSSMLVTPTSTPDLSTNMIISAPQVHNARAPAPAMPIARAAQEVFLALKIRTGLSTVNKHFVTTQVIPTQLL